jgi:hypothetical protein
MVPPESLCETAEGNVRRPVSRGSRGPSERIDDLNTTLLEELEKFFVNYHAVDDETFRVLGRKDPRRAGELIGVAARRWRKQRDRRAGK